MFKDPTAYTYASPRAGDEDFVSTYNQVVKDTFRVANRIDIVSKLPFTPPYEPVDTLLDLNPILLLPLPPKILVKPDLACEHVLNTYLHLMSLNSGGPILPLDAGVPALISAASDSAPTGGGVPPVSSDPGRCRFRGMWKCPVRHLESLVPLRRATPAPPAFRRRLAHANRPVWPSPDRAESARPRRGLGGRPGQG